MATFADVISVGVLGPFFSFLFMAILGWAFARFIPRVGHYKWFGVAFGFILGFLTLLSPTSIGLVQYMAPWFAIIMFFVALIFIIIKYLTADVGAAGPQFKGVYGVAGALTITFLVIGAGGYLRDKAMYDENPVEGIEGETMQPKPALLIFNPTVLGAIVMLAIAAFAIALLTVKSV